MPADQMLTTTILDKILWRVYSELTDFFKFSIFKY